MTCYREPPGKRSPAYTDRIFFQHHNPDSGKDNVHVTVHHYALGRLVESDHKPVSCYVTVRIEEPDKPTDPEHFVVEEQTEGLLSMRNLVLGGLFLGAVSAAGYFFWKK